MRQARSRPRESPFHSGKISLLIIRRQWCDIHGLPRAVSASFSECYRIFAKAFLWIIWPICGMRSGVIDEPPQRSRIYRVVYTYAVYTIRPLGFGGPLWGGLGFLLAALSCPART